MLLDQVDIAFDDEHAVAWAGHWAIPGLVAVGAGTLGALGLWLGYRRPHLASLSR